MSTGRLAIGLARRSAASTVRRAARSAAGCLVADRDRWVLWLPVGWAIGVGVYFALPFEPPWPLGPAVLVVSLVCERLAAGATPSPRSRVRFVALAIGLVAAGYSAAQLRTATVAAPALADRIGPAGVSGRIVAVETLPDGVRVTLDRAAIGGLAPESTPRRLRIRLRGEPPPLQPGNRIAVRAILSPPAAPAAPGAFDFQRQSFFQSLGAVGFAVSPVEVVAMAAGDEAGGPWLALAELRLAVADRVRERLPGATGAIAVALVTGERAAIPQPVMAAIRDSGLAHLLAISGLHIGLVAGFLFAGVRGLLALVPPLALRFPIKKWAAVVSIAGSGGYVLLAGATVPSQRAFLMVALVLAAVLVDRRAISMRPVAWAALVILALRPESLLGASFQLSFAAVIALVATYEMVRRLRPRRLEPPTAWRRLALYLGGVALTTLVAGLATAPFAVFHFNRFAVFGLAANLLAVPVTALWIMPWALAAVLLMPFGLAGLALTPMGWGIEVVIGVAEAVAAWPAAVALVPAMPTWGIVCVALGGCWFCLWTQRWRVFGLVGVTAGLASLATVQQPDVLIDGRGKLLGVRGADGALAVSSLQAAPFSREAWLRADARDAAAAWPRSGFDKDGRLACDPLGCVLRTAGHVVALVRTPEALDEDCRIAEVVISTVPVRGPCPAAHTVVDRFDLWRDGAHAVWLRPGAVRVRSVNATRGRRPWVIGPPPRRD